MLIEAILCPDCASDTLDPRRGEEGQFCEACGTAYPIAECVLVGSDDYRIR